MSRNSAGQRTLQNPSHLPKIHHLTLSAMYGRAARTPPATTLLLSRRRGIFPIHDECTDFTNSLGFRCDFALETFLPSAKDIDGGRRHGVDENRLGHGMRHDLRRWGDFTIIRRREFE